MSWSGCLAKKILEYSKPSVVNFPFYLFSDEYKNILYDTNRRHLALALLSSLSYHYHRSDIIESLLLVWGPCEYNIIKENNGLVYLHIKLDDEDIVAFKGSSHLIDYIVDADIFIVDDNFNIPGKIHKGFMNYLFTNNQHMKIIENMKSKKLTVTGHSLGASTAVLMAAFIKANIHMDMTLCVFGCPRVGTRQFSKAVYGVFYKNGSDVITSLPLPPWYWHSGRQVQIGTRSINFSIEDHHISNYISNL